MATKKRQLSIEALAAAAERGEDESNSSHSSSSPPAGKRTRLHVLTPAQLITRAEEAVAALSRPPVTLLDEMRGVIQLQPADSKSWILQLSIENLVDIINAPAAGGEECLLGFDELSRLASLSNMWFVLFHNPHYDLWGKATVARIGRNKKGLPLAPKFTFVTKYFQDKRIKALAPSYLGGLVAYLNLFGTGFCTDCGMYPDCCAETHLIDDEIPLSAFRLETTAEKARRMQHPEPLDDSILLAPFEAHPEREIPDWLRNMLYLLRNVENRYLCIACTKPLRQEICGFFVPGIFEACLTKRGGKGHVWRNCPNDLRRPDGSLIDMDLDYCTRCSVLRKADDEEKYGSAGCSECDEEPCVCEPCELCDRPESQCRCEVCAICEGCTAANCSVCDGKGAACEGHDSSSESSSFASSSDAYSSDSSDSSD